MSLDRRSFLKFLGLSTVAGGASVAAVVPVIAAEDEKDDYLVKEWTEDGITYLEYMFPATVQALFKNKDRTRAIYCPIRKINVVQKKEFLDVTQTVRTENLYGVLGVKEITVSLPPTEELVTEESLLKTTVNYAKMHMATDGEEWKNPHIYMVRIIGHQELFGIIMNKERLSVERDNYTVYA